MLHTWENALSAYRYPFDFTLFDDAVDHPGWFDHSTGAGSRAETAEFENRFRQCGPFNLEAWYEIVFRKLFSQQAFAKVTLGV